MEFIKSFNPSILKKKLSIIKIDTDISNFPEKKIKLIEHLIECARVLDKIFLLQKHPENLKVKEEIRKSADRSAFDFYNAVGGVLDHFNNDAPYITGIDFPDKTGLYPFDISKEEFELYIKKNPMFKEDFISPYTVIERDNNGQLKAVKYSECYKDLLSEASMHIDNALKYTGNYSLKEYFQALKKAFFDNDFYDAERKWLMLDADDIVPLLGPFEEYIDNFMGYKAAFTGFVSLKNNVETEKINFLIETLPMLQEKFPIPKHYKKTIKKEFSRIEVVDLVYYSGDIRTPIPTIAFNLPNSESIKKEFGTKKILIYNILRAKFDALILPISEIMLDKKDKTKVSFLSYYHFVLLHEISHELGIGQIEDSEGKLRDLSYFLKDIYAVIEEAKADIMGVYSLIFLNKESFLSSISFTEICICFLINLARAIRFGVENAHGQSCLIQLNYLVKESVFIFNEESKTITTDFQKFEKSVEKLLVIILTIQGEGDYKMAKDFINQYSYFDEKLRLSLELLDTLPVDICPWFPLASESEPFTG